MDHRLFVYIKSLEPLNVIFMVQDENAPHHYKEISALPVSKKPYQTVVIISPWDVSLHTVQLPTIKPSQQHQAVLYSLEEQLIDKLEDLHFAYQWSPDRKTAAVAVISHEKMKQYLAQLSEIGIQADWIVPASFLLKETSDAMDQRDLLFKNIPNETDLLLDFQENKLINLLQPPYCTSKKISWDPQRNKRLMFSLITLVSFVFILKICFLLKLNEDLHQISKKTDAIYMHYFPKATAIVDPKRRLNTLLSEREQWSQKKPFLQMLDWIAKSMASTASLQIIDLQYRDNTLEFVVMADQLKTLETFNDALKKSPYSVVQTQTAALDHAVKATFHMRGTTG